MRMTLTGYFVAIACLVSACAAYAADDPPTPDGWQLVWADEFDEDGRPDPANWRFEQGFVRNEELQWYQPDNARCQDGILVIEARTEQKPNPNYREGSRDWRESRKTIEYTSSCLLSRGLREWTYGRFEMRARIDTRAGLWPAFWTLGYQRGWPECGELDIMEYYRGMILANAAWGGARRWQPTWDDSKTPLRELGDADWPNRYHVWRMDWTEEKIEFFVDDRLLNTVSCERAVNRDGTTPLKEPHYLLLNLAVGGRNGGDPGATEFPARFEVDYVRVYEKSPTHSP